MEVGFLETAFELLLYNSNDMIFLKDKDLIYRAVSMPFVKMVGKTDPYEIIGHTDREIFADVNLAVRYETDDKRILAKQQEQLNFVEPITDEDGHPRYGSTSKFLVHNQAGETTGILGVTKDITTEYRARQRYQQELRYLFEMPEDTYAVCYVDVDDWRIIKQRRQPIVDGTLQECQTVEELCEYAVKSIITSNSEIYEFYHDFMPVKLWSIYASGRNHLTYEYERIMSDGSVRWIQNDIHFLTDVDSGHLCVMLSAKDIDATKREEEKILNAARLDRMTHVLNRETAMESIEQILKNEKDSSHVLFMLDVDNFKKLNDIHGHIAGDEFLVKLANNLKKAVRDRDVLGRIGGDEFFIFLRNLTGRSSIEKKANQILKIVTDCASGYNKTNISGSIGVSMYPNNGNTLDKLYANADVALYSAKEAGKGQFVFAE